MEIQETLRLLRKKNGYSQEGLAEKLGVARQTVGKWETGQALPELNALVLLSDLYGVPVDRILRGAEPCQRALVPQGNVDCSRTKAFLLAAKRHTYAAAAPQVASCRTASHDYHYEDSQGFAYHDSYFGGERFAGEETAWLRERPLWCMNYAGRVTGEHFSGDFLKEALLAVPEDLPFRGPEVFEKGDYLYHCNVTGDFGWFQGREDIFYRGARIYECFFHGGEIRE